MGFHPAMNAAHTVWGVRQFDIAAFLRFQARGLREVGVKRPAVPPAVRRRVTARLPRHGFRDERDASRLGFEASLGPPCKLSQLLIWGRSFDLQRKILEKPSLSLICNVNRRPLPAFALPPTRKVKLEPNSGQVHDKRRLSLVRNDFVRFRIEHSCNLELLYDAKLLGGAPFAILRQISAGLELTCKLAKGVGFVC